MRLKKVRKILVVLILIPLILTAASPKLRIGYYGHSMFEIVLPSGTRIITDPFEPATGPAFPIGVVADVVVMSHSHTDHSYSAGVGGEPIEIAWADGSAHGIDFLATPTKHFLDGEEGENNIMTWETEGFKFNHMGDYWDDFSSEDSAALANTTFLFLPVGGFYTMDAALANDIINNTGPVVAFPMHYRTPDHSPDFAELLTLEEANASFTFDIVEHEPWIAIDGDNLPQGPIIWEPAYSADLPGDLAVTSIDVTISPPYMFGVNVVNNTPRDGDDATLILNVLDGFDVVYADTGTISVPGNDAGFGEFGPWGPPETKEYTLFAEVTYPADEVPPNDTFSSAVTLTGVVESGSEESLRLEIYGIENDAFTFRYAFPGGRGQISIYDVTGVKADQINLESDQGSFTYQSTHLPRGLFFAKLVTPRGCIVKKFVKVR